MKSFEKNTEFLIECGACDSTQNHLTLVKDTLHTGKDYPPNECNYKQGAVEITVQCEVCGHTQKIIAGEHKGQVFLTIKEEN